MHGQERASLNRGTLRIVTRTWGDGEYQADLYADHPTLAGNKFSLVQLNHCEPEALRAFAQALLEVADETEHQYDESGW